MKTPKKNCYLVGLLIPVCILFAAVTYAQQAETTKEAKESLNICGSGKIKITYNSKNHPDKEDVSPALITLSSPETKQGQEDGRGQNINPLVTAPSVAISLEKTILWGEDPIKLAAGIAIDQEKAKLSKAFAEFKNCELGLQASNFGDSDIAPNTLGGTPNSAVGRKAAQLRLKHCINPDISCTFSLEEAAAFKLSEEYEDQLEEHKDKLKECENRVGPQEELSDEITKCRNAIKGYEARLSKKPCNHTPAFTLSLRYNYPNSRGHIHVGFLGRFIQYYDTVSRETSFPLAGGISIGTQVQLIPEQTTLKFQGVCGSGIGGYIADLADLEKEDNTAYVKVNDADNTTSFHSINAYGAYLALEHRWLPQLRSTLVISGLQTAEDQNRAREGYYKRGLYGSCSLAYHPTEQLHVGGEYSLGQKTSLDGKDAKAYGFRVVAGFKF